MPYGDDVLPREAPSRIALPEAPDRPVRGIAVRVAIALACIVVVTVIVHADQGGYRDIDSEPVTLSWIDALYYATVSLSTTGYGDITPVTDEARLVNVFVITPLRFVFLIVLVGTTIEILTRRGREQFRRTRWRNRVKDHIVVVGYGVKGRTAAQTLLEHGNPPESVVVVTADPRASQEVNATGMVAVVGDARRDEVLLDAGIQRATRVIIAADDDATSVLITLSVRRMAPGADVVVAVRESQNAALLKEAGARSVIMTAEAAGRMLGLASTSEHAGDLLEDILSPGTGLEIVQRGVGRDDLGRAPRDLAAHDEIVLGVVRGGELHRFDSRDSVRVLQTGDQVVVIRPADDTKEH